METTSENTSVAVPVREKIKVPSDSPLTEVGDDGKIYTNVLRVSADPSGTSAEQRRANVKKTAGAIAHGIRRFGEIHVRSIGKEATYKAIKAIIEASGYVAVSGHDLYTRPGYMMTEKTEGHAEMTGIAFFVMTSTSSGIHNPSE
jgi:stage V sporulation protein SpoVS